MVWFGRGFLNWFDLGGCDCKSLVVGLLFMVLVCGGGICDDGGEAVVLVSTSGAWGYTPIGFGGWVSCRLSFGGGHGGGLGQEGEEKEGS